MRDKHAITKALNDWLIDTGPWILKKINNGNGFRQYLKNILANGLCLYLIAWIPWNLSFRYILFHDKRLPTMLWHHNARVNSHQRWKQTRFRVCFHLWCELTNTMNVTEWQVSWNSPKLPLLITCPDMEAFSRLSWETLVLFHLTFHLTHSAFHFTVHALNSLPLFPTSFTGWFVTLQFTTWKYLGDTSTAQHRHDIE